jgi:hypothetical protein
MQTQVKFLNTTSPAHCPKATLDGRTTTIVTHNNNKPFFIRFCPLQLGFYKQESLHMNHCWVTPDRVLWLCFMLEVEGEIVKARTVIIRTGLG